MLIPPIADAHCDTLMQLVGDHPKGASLLETLPGHLDLPRLIKARVSLQVFALFWNPSHGPEMGLRRILEMIAQFHRSAEASEGRLYPVLSADDVNPRAGCVGGLLAVEGMSSIGGSVELLEVLYRLGVRSAMLTWNERNSLADGALDQASGGGLSAEGRRIVEAMQRLHMVMDVSHLAEKAFWSLLECSDGPLIASHSNAKALRDHPRNLTDEQLRAVAARGGVIGMNFYTDFIVDAETARLSDLVRHIRYIAELVGPQHVGLGSDFDGIGSAPEGLESVDGYQNLRAALSKDGFSQEEAEGVLGGNLRRVLGQILA